MSKHYFSQLFVDFYDKFFLHLKKKSDHTFKKLTLLNFKKEAGNGLNCKLAVNETWQWNKSDHTFTAHLQVQVASYSLVQFQQCCRHSDK